MREILIPMPRIEREHRVCSVCDDELTPNLKVYMLGSYVEKTGFEAKYAHPQCAKKAGLVRAHTVEDSKVLEFWQRLARVLAGRPATATQK